MSRLLLTASIAAWVWLVAFGGYLATTWATGHALNLTVLAFAFPALATLWVAVCRAMRHQRVLDFLTWVGVIR